MNRSGPSTGTADCLAAAHPRDDSVMPHSEPLWSDDSILTALGAVRLAAMPFHASMMGIEWLEYGPTDFVPRAKPGPLTLDDRGRIAPVTMATLLDMMLGHAARAASSPGTRIMTMNLAVQLTLDLPRDGSVTGRARVVNRGSHIIATAGDLTDESGQVIGTARGMFVQRPVAKSSPLAPEMPTTETQVPANPADLDEIELAVFDERRARARPVSDPRAESEARSGSAARTGHDWYVGFERGEAPEPDGNVTVLPTALFTRNRTGFVQGGLVGGLLLSAAAGVPAVADNTFRLADFTCTYLRPGRVAGPPITATARTRYAGGRSACVTVDAQQEPGVDLAIATATFTRE